MKKFIKLEIGRDTSVLPPTDSTTQTMNFTRMNHLSKTMRILDAIIDHPGNLTQDTAIEHAYGIKRPSRSWCMGLISALHHFGLISYKRAGHKFMCVPTEAGIKFYNNTCMAH